eukprot:119081_1
METCTPKELSLNISSLPNQNEDQTNQIQSKHDDDESTSHNNDMLYCTKRKMLFSSCAIALSIGICSVLLILNINDDDQESDLKLCAMFFVLCMIIAMSFNENNSKKRYIFIAILMVTICSIFSFVLLFATLNAGSYLSFVSFTSGIAFMMILTFDKKYHNSTQSSWKTVLKSMWKEKSMFTPLVTHLADTASDIGLTVEFYFAAQRQKSGLESSDIQYETLFYLSITIMCFYRLVTSIVMYYFNRSVSDALLQLMDVFLFKALVKSWNLGLVETGLMQRQIQFLEALFESFPQALITFGIIMKSNEPSALVWISAFLSVVSIAQRIITEDAPFFTDESQAKEFGFKKECACSQYRVLCCNLRYVLRWIWRYCDVIHWLLLIVGVWVFHSGTAAFVSVGLIGGLSIAFFALKIWQGGSTDFLLLYQTVAIIFASNIYAFIMLWVKLVLEFNMCYRGKWHIELYIILWVLYTFKWLFYFGIVKQVRIAVAEFSIPLFCYGTTWVDLTVTTMREVQGCENIKQLKELLSFGYSIHKTVQCAALWKGKTRLNILEVVDLVKTEYPQMKWNEIECNDHLDEEYDKLSILQILAKCSCDEQLQSKFNTSCNQILLRIMDGKYMNIVHAESQNTLLHYLCMNERISHWDDRLLDVLKRDIDKQNNNGQTPIMFACAFQKNCVLMKKLIRNCNCNLELRDYNHQRTALHHLARNCNLEDWDHSLFDDFKKFLQYEDRNGNDPLIVVVHDSPNCQLIKAMDEYSAGQMDRGQMLIYLCTNRHVMKWDDEFLLSFVQHVHLTNNEGETPLILASKHQTNCELTKRLIKMKANVNAMSMYRLTALDVAVNRLDDMRGVFGGERICCNVCCSLCICNFCQHSKVKNGIRDIIAVLENEKRASS